jgi:hypothetical protein
MSKAAPYQVDEAGADLPRECPPGQVSDPSYKTRGTESVPVVDDEAPVDDPIKPGQADSDQQLGAFSHIYCHFHECKTGRVRGGAMQ